MLTQKQISDVISKVASQYPIKRIFLFGSYATGTNTPNSDVDLLVEFDTESVSLLTISSFKNNIEEMLSLPVDVIRTPIPEGSLIKPEKVIQIYAA